MDDKQPARSVSAESLLQARRRIGNALVHAAVPLWAEFQQNVEFGLDAYATLAVEAEREQLRQEVERELAKWINSAAWSLGFRNAMKRVLALLSPAENTSKS